MGSEAPSGKVLRIARNDRLVSYEKRSAKIAVKEELLAKTTPIPGKVRRYKPTDRLLEFLQAL